LGEGPAGGDGREEAVVRGDRGRHAAEEQAHDAVAGADAGDVGGCLQDDSGAFAADQVLVRVDVEGDHDVAEVQCGRAHGDAHFSRP
jgi:hypothetical protein